MEKEQEIKQIIKEIKIYQEKEKLTFFVGAGVSKMSDYPSWSELVLTMASEIGYNVRENGDGKPELSTEEFLKIPQMYYNTKSELAYLEKVRAQLNIKKSPNNIHKLIMKMNPYHLITTNYDDLLEQTANLFGVNYSVINSDKKVAQVSTQRYKLKVHGDFEENNFVLKEADYLNYEQNFKLIDNITKTIMATNMIVFIGYLLSDYNIKLILNWVQNVQGDSFIKPVFIYTDLEKLSDISIDYYKKRGLRIICAYDLCKSDSYEERYESVLKEMLSQLEKPQDNSIKYIINFLYTKLRPLDEIEYLRANDFIRIFNDQGIDKNNMINENQYNSVFEKFFQAYYDKEIPHEYHYEADYIMGKIQKSGILGCYSRNRCFTGFNNLEICNRDFYSNYSEIENQLSMYGNNSEDLYNKAYDLCMLGRLNEAYHIYVDLLGRFKEEKKWFYYYFTQFNLKCLSQIIKSIDSMTKGFRGIINFGAELDLFEPQLLKEVGLLQAFSDMPAEIKKYSFLSKLSSNNYYADDIVRLYDENYNITLEVSKRNVAILGTATYDKTEILMKDAINFIYNNRLIFSLFSEHKKFIKTTMYTYLMGKSGRMDIPLCKTLGIKKEIFEITFQDILLLIKNYKLEDLQFLINNVDIKQFKISDKERQEFEKYVEYTIGYYCENFCGNISGDKINMYILIKEEIKNLCYLGQFFISSKKIFAKYIGLLVSFMPEKELRYEKRLEILDQIKLHVAGVDEIITSEVNKMLIEKVSFCLDNSNYNLLRHWYPVIEEYSVWLNKMFPEYRSDELLKICTSKQFSTQDKKFLESLLPIINTTANTRGQTL